MVAFTSVLALVATFAVARVAGNPADAIHELIARQSPTINPSSFPTQCQNQCTPLVDSISNNCTDLACLCGSTMSKNLMNCWECGASIVGTETAQSAYNSYANACNSAGHSVPSFTATGSSGGLSGASGSSSGSSGSTGSSGTGGASRAQVAGAGIIAAAAALLLAV